jgi:hypothetical protein
VLDMGLHFVRGFTDPNNLEDIKVDYDHSSDAYTLLVKPGESRSGVRNIYRSVLLEKDEPVKLNPKRTIETLINTPEKEQKVVWMMTE